MIYLRSLDMPCQPEAVMGGGGASCFQIQLCQPTGSSWDLQVPAGPGFDFASCCSGIPRRSQPMKFQRAHLHLVFYKPSNLL